MFRSQTDEQLAAKWDVRPASEWPYVPRPECIPSRDVPGMIDAVRCDDGTWDQVELYEGAFEDAVDTSRPPVNPILMAFRDALRSGEYEIAWLASLWVGLMVIRGGIFEAECEDATPEQIDHARKVLTRLAALA